MNDGIYRLYRYVLAPGGVPEKHLMGRFAIHQGNCEHLEDHTHTLGDIVPEGPVSERHQKVFDRLTYSPHYHLQNEDDIQAGIHPEDVPEADLGPLVPDATFTMMVPGASQPLPVEVVGDVATVAGQKLTPEQTQALLAQIQAGQVQIQPSGGQNVQQGR